MELKFEVPSFRVLGLWLVSHAILNPKRLRVLGPFFELTWDITFRFRLQASNLSSLPVGPTL